MAGEDYCWFSYPRHLSEPRNSLSWGRLIAFRVKERTETLPGSMTGMAVGDNQMNGRGPVSGGNMCLGLACYRGNVCPYLLL